MIEFKFNETKTTQAAALFLKKSGGKLSYMKLIKLLYLADRGALALWERSITGDTYFSMKRGPVLSNVLDIISNGDDPENSSYWYKYISQPNNNYEIKLDELPEIDTLSQRELDLIDELYEEFKDFDRWEMVKLCHEMLPEWEDVERNTRKLIEIDIILEKVDKSPDEIKAIGEEVSNLNYVKEILSIND
ncbi:MAG: Panacea domain-containing protein [Candidatus Scalindua sp.]